MPWSDMLRQLDGPGVVEFGIHQMNEKAGSPKWRRHQGGPRFRFDSVHSALFSTTKGARVACLGRSTYVRERYSAVSTSVVPYVATWWRGGTLAFLVRAGASEPEITLVSTSDLERIDDSNHHELLSELARLFGEGAHTYGVRHLTSNGIQTL